MITKRVDAITELSEEYSKIITPTPPSVKIELTARCDLKCFFCASSHKLRSKGDMDFVLLERILRELKEVGVKEIGMFYLGESLLYPRLSDAIKLAKDIGFEYVFLTTNGRLLTKDKAKEIMGAGLDSLKFSFNFSNRQQYEESTGVDGFNTVVENIRNAYQIRNERYKCGLYASSIKYNGQLMEVKEIKDSVDEHNR